MPRMMVELPLWNWSGGAKPPSLRLLPAGFLFG